MTSPRLRWRWLEWLTNLSVAAVVVGAGVAVALNAERPRGIDVCQETTAFDRTCRSAASWDVSEPTMTITESVTLDSPYEGPIEIAADGVTLDCAGHSVRGGNGVGIYVSRRSGVTIRDCAVSGFDTGILLDRTTDSVLSDNVAEANDTGFFLSLADGNQLTGNSADRNRIGFEILGSDDNLLNDNSTWLGLVGIGLADANSNVLQGNEIVEARSQGMAIEDAVGTIIRENEFTGTELGGPTAVDLDSVSGATVSDNTVTAGRLGFAMQGVTDSTFESNQVSNTGGFWIRTSHGNTFHANEIVGASETAMWGLAMSVGNDFTDNVGADLSEPLTLAANHTLEADHLGRIVIAADDITLDCAGHRIEAPASSNRPNQIEAGIEIRRHTGVTIENCDVAGYEYGIVLWHADANTIRNNTSGVDLLHSDDNEVTGIKATRIRVRGSDHNTITGCTVFGSGNFTLGNSHSNTLEGNTLWGGSLLTVKHSNRNTVAGNTVDGGLLIVEAAKSNTITDNTVTSIRDEGPVYVVGKGATKNLFADNVAKRGGIGFRLNESSNNTYRNNVTVDSEVAFRLVDSTGNTFEGNDASGSSSATSIKGSNDNTYVDNIGF